MMKLNHRAKIAHQCCPICLRMTDTGFTTEELAWFRRPLKEGR